MAEFDHDIVIQIAKAGQQLMRTLTSYRGFIQRTVKRHEESGGGDQMDYAVAVLHRELEWLDPVLDGPFAFDALGSGNMTRADVVALSRFSEMLGDLAQHYAEDSNHQTQMREALQATAFLWQSERDRIKNVRSRIAGEVEMVSALAGRLAPAEQGPVRAPAGRTPASPPPGGSGGNISGGGYSMPQDDNGKNGASDLDGVVDAISRLQGTHGTAAGAAGASSYNAFASALDQRINLTLGMPSLSSDSARALDADVLVGKLFEGLSRTVAEDEIGGVRTYSVNPLRARSAGFEGEGLALGAQAVTAASIRNLKEPILANLYRLTSETVIGEQDEAEDLRIAISDGLDKLIAEANSESGIYLDWAIEILVQVTIDLFRLAALYDILDSESLPRDLHGFAFAFLVQNEPDALLRFFEPAVDRILREPDIGILTAEANDRAFFAIVSSLITATRLLTIDPVELGPLLGRIRVINDTMPASVIAARNALAAAGVSEADQAVAYSKMEIDRQKFRGMLGDREIRGEILEYTGGGISLRRLLAWIENECLTSRPMFLREDFSVRDLERLKAARVRQLQALERINDKSFVMINANNYALGRRHLNEITDHLRTMVDLMEVLSAKATQDERDD
ncbi:MAG: hypothetical protein HKN63_06470 [Rhodobacteraceae bacterium]|nr:hypothetical protein [Paracoccaceae bacterium]